MHLLTRTAVFGALLATAATAQPQYTVYPVAGRGIGDGRVATEASLDTPQGVAVAPDGALLIADTRHHRIRRVDPTSGVIDTVAGTYEGTFGTGFPATAAQLKVPVRVEVMPNGDYLIVERGSNRIRRLRQATGLLEAFAGTGAPGLSGDGGLATAAQLNQPNDVAIDAAGNVYVADFFNHVIRKVDPSGIITTVPADGTAEGSPGGAFLNYPSCVAVGPSDELYVCDKGNNRIRRIQNGVMETVAGNGTPGFNGDGVATAVSLNQPEDLVVDPTGRLIVSDLGNGRLRVVDLAANQILTVASGLADPAGLAMDAAGNVLVAERAGNEIKAMAPDGTVTTVAGDGIARFGGDGGGRLDATFNEVKGVALDAAGNIFISDDGNNRIRKVDAQTGIVSTVAGNGTTDVAVDGVPATVVGLDAPSDVIVDSVGTMLIADTGHNRVRWVNANGIIGTLAGTGEAGYSGDGGPSALARLDHPTGLALDAAGNVYFSDFGNNVIRRIRPDGMIETVAGTGLPGYDGDNKPATLAALTTPTDVTVDPFGNLYIADFGNERVRRVDAATGIITTVAGTGDAHSSADNLPAVTTPLNGPSDVVVDPDGNLLIAESRANRIRIVDTLGVINTVAGSTTPGGSGDEGPAIEATFLTPLRLFGTPDGRVFVSDEHNSRVRLLVPPGVDPGLPPDGTTPPPPPGDDDSCRGTRKQCLMGGGSSKTDCFLEFWVKAPPDGSPRRAVCKDGDDACDLDGEAGQCTVRISICFNNDDSRLSSCQPGSTTAVQLVRPRPTSKKANEKQAAADILQELGKLGGNHVKSGKKPLLTYDKPLDGDTTCINSVTVTVPTKGRKKGKMKLALKALQGAGSSGKRDVDKLAIICEP